MHESPMAARPGLRWVEVTDDGGRTRLEMRWSAPAAPAVPAATALTATTPSLPAVTHAA